MPVTLPLDLEGNLSLLPSPYMIWWCVPLPTSPHAPCSSRSSPSPVAVVCLTLRVSLSKTEFMLRSFCPELLSLWLFLWVKHQLSGLYSDTMLPYVPKYLLVPFWNKSPFRFCLITPGIYNCLILLIRFLDIISLLERELDEDRGLIGLIHCYIPSV